MNNLTKIKFVLAPDSFKKSVTAKEVAYAMEKRIKKVLKNSECIKVSILCLQEREV
ncbi:glycerate kinase [Clostridium sporogenes]|uniref:glycerate kinase n=1 Tax=Clostridium sporogenes TaxID=1509 RepID=UPI000A911CFD|nr:glycerate kinase [Clostridium sporogenes]